MYDRCYNPKNIGYARYGGRGVVMCDGLRESPAYLVALIGLRNDYSLSIDRIDNEGMYSCGACAECKTRGWSMNLKWSTRTEQARNRRTNRHITIGGVTRLISDWTRIAGLGSKTIHKRIKRGWTEADLLLPSQR